LSAAEFDGAYSILPSERLVSGCYLNELLLTLFARHDTHADVFDLYSAALSSLKTAADALPVLRVFEKRLLEALGYGLSLHRDAITGQPIDSSRTYHYRLEQGPVAAMDVAEGPLVFSGATLQALAREELHDAMACQDARRLLRAALDRVLDGKELKSRQVMLALRKK
jgi:DNA repair protein RecO (recombination protein O)